MRKYIVLFALLVVATVAAKAFSPGEVPTVGNAAPAFKLTTNEGKEASLSDFKGKWVVLYFYPKDFTSGLRFKPATSNATWRSMKRPRR